MGGIGVQRALSIAKYLPRTGFEVHVLRARNAAGPVYDPDLLLEIPKEARIHDSFTPELPFGFRQKLWHMFGRDNSRQPVPAAELTPGGSGRRWFRWRTLPLELGKRILCPEPEVLWVPFALRAARRIIRENDIDSLLITAPPFSAFLIGIRLKQEFQNIDLISDFRDDWLRFYTATFDYQQSDYTRRRVSEIERRTVESSDAVVVVTDTMLNDYRARYPSEPGKKFICIPNGYDPELFDHLETGPAPSQDIIVTYAGTVYSASSARYYLDALDSLPAEIRSSFHTRFVGRITHDEESHFHGRQSVIQKVGFLPQHETIRMMAASDYLLVTMTDAASLTGKLFEYLATGRPILAVAPENGEIARILRATAGGWCAAPEDRAGIRDMLIRAYEFKRNGSAFLPNSEEIRRYERPRLVAQFRALLTREKQSEMALQR